NLSLDPFATKALNNALEKAIISSVDNFKGFDDNTRVLIASDVSSSMQTPISPNSQVTLYDIGLLMGQLLQTKCKNVITGFFGDTWKVTDFSSGNVLNNTLNLYNREGEVGYSTNGYKVLQWLNTKNIEVDKIMFFTDCQLWNSNNGYETINLEWQKYKKVHTNSKLYLFDLGGHGTVPLDVMSEKNVFLISGWSDKIFEVMDSLEKGVTVVDFIKDTVVYLTLE
ncbi:MAG: TROVE domain-containing protein, partial [Porphyromonadaceae bacterium]|nr:TROVE domain-containing protein [Porphyromonadaceae bacterium]